MDQLPDFLIIPRQIITDKNLRPLDGQVYGVVYWYRHLKLQKCIASNKQIALMLNVSTSGVANALSRLAKRGHVKIILDEIHHRTEIVPMISFSPPEPLLNPVTPLTQMSNPPYSNVEENNIDLKRIIKENNPLTPYNPSSSHKPKGEKWRTCPVKQDLFGLKTRYPNKVDPHEECNEYIRSIENNRKIGFANYNEQMFCLHDLLKAGWDFEDFDWLIKKVEEKQGKHKWDFFTLVRWASKEGMPPSKKTQFVATDDGFIEERSYRAES